MIPWKRVSALDGHPPLHVQSVTIRHADMLDDRPAVDDVSLQVAPGTIYTLLGANGAGKSTLLKAIAGTRPVCGGKITISGYEARRQPAAQRFLGYVPQYITLFDHLTVFENLMTFAAVFGVRGREARVLSDRMIDEIGLGEKRNAIVAALSGGMRRRVHIAAALLHDPPLLLLDEPTAGLDDQSKAALRTMLLELREKGLAILLTTHELEEAEAIADHVGVLVQGQMRIEGTVDELAAVMFERRRSVALRFSEALSPEHAGQLRGAGLIAEDDGVSWAGLVDAGQGVSALLSALSQFTPVPADIDIRQPDLKTLVASLRREGTS